MKNSKALFQEIVSAVNLKESPEEIQAIAQILFENVFGVSRTDIMTGKMVSYPPETAERLQKAVERINRHEPVQYVVGEEYFYGRKFQVNYSVLIPRPETELLIRAVLAHKNQLLLSNIYQPPFRILDIGTGSGCIPITLFLEIRDAEVYGTDISNAALSVASNNADVLKAEVTLIENNILREPLPVANLDVIVSNPPYVTEKEKPALQPNVRDYEPHEALFVPDDDPLVFYKEIIRQARQALKPKGLLAVEINEKSGKQVSELFIGAGFNEVEVVEDLAGKQRVVRGLNGRA